MDLLLKSKYVSFALTVGVQPADEDDEIEIDNTGGDFSPVNDDYDIGDRGFGFRG